MLNNFIQFLSRNFAVFFAIISLQIISGVASAESYVSTNDVVKEIEKTLLFDQGAREEINAFAAKKKKSKKSDYTIKAGITDEKSDVASDIDITVTDSKALNLDVKEKEKLAYNAALTGQYEVAIELYKQVLKSEPDNSYDKFSLAVVYQRIGQFRQAKTLYYQLLKTNPTNQEEIIGNLLSVLVEESPRDAVYLLSRLTVQNPSSAYIFAQAAVAYDKIKNYDQAIILLQKAISIDQTNADYQYNLAVIYDKTSQFQKALDMYANVEQNYTDDNSSVPIEQVRDREAAIKSKI
jgi:tetratricopeptide (TPR) repeat protein